MFLENIGCIQADFSVDVKRCFQFKSGKLNGINVIKTIRSCTGTRGRNAVVIDEVFNIIIPGSCSEMDFIKTLNDSDFIFNSCFRIQTGVGLGGATRPPVVISGTGQPV